MTTEKGTQVGARLDSVLVSPDSGSHHSLVERNWSLAPATLITASSRGFSIPVFSLDFYITCVWLCLYHDFGSSQLEKTDLTSLSSKLKELFDYC